MGLFLSFTLTLTSGCATYQGKVSEARDLLAAGKYDAAIAILKPLAEKEDDDQLVYLLDYATALQAKGQYEDSSKAFILADKLAEKMDYHSVSNIGASLLLSEEMVQYKGDDFEKLLIHVMAALNYTLLGNYEAARVETRRLTEKINYFRLEKKLKYADNPFMYYLNAHIWEASKDWDSAYIDFKKAYDLGMNNSMIQEDLIRISERSRRPDELSRWQRKFSGENNSGWKNRLNGEVILIYQQGWGPRKAPRRDSPRFPTLVPVTNETPPAALIVDGKEAVRTESAYDVQSAAMTAFETQYAALVAKRLAAIAAKEVAAHQIAKKDELAGAAAWIFMHATDRADLRQWSTLPRSIQMARIYLPEGNHRIQIRGSSGPQSEEITLKVKAGKKHFVGWRSF